MYVPFILCIILLISGQEELDANWNIAIIAFLIIALVSIYLLNLFPMFFVVALVLVDIILILKVYGGDITIR
jgi:hypothetical protein